MAKKTFYWIFGIVLLAGIIFATVKTTGANNFEAVDGFEGDITIYKSGECGCCGVYGGYFTREGNSDTKIVNLEDIGSIKLRYGVPSQMESCHTTILESGDKTYFVEGHIPLEAVEKLLIDKPDIKGIAMPGMPNGSPGMQGAKKGDFVIYAVNNDGTWEEWMRL